VPGGHDIPLIGPRLSCDIARRPEPGSPRRFFRRAGTQIFPGVRGAGVRLVEAKDALDFEGASGAELWA
jgi:hypothetical protein